MVTVCQQCGDRGYYEALIDCEKCQTTAVHFYCLPVLPASFEDDVIWYCEDCEPKVAEPLIGDNPNFVLVGTCDSKNLEIEQATQSVKTKNSLIAGGDYKSNPLYSGNVPCSDSDKPYAKLGRLIVLDESRSDEEAESFKTRTSREVTNDPLTTPECISNVCKNSIIEVQCKENDEKDLRLIRWRVSEGGNSTEETESIKNETSLIATSRPSNIPEHSYAPAQPIIEPIWKGSLRLSNDKYGTIEGVVAHLSTSACSKVFQEANLLPQLLCPELLPRSNAWPKSFQKLGPSDANIALYFFPNNERAEIVYDSLVDDMISKDVALRSVVKNAELLLFTSNLLPCQFWRFQSKFYLWGVFRAKQASQSRALALHTVNVISSLAEPKDHANALTWFPQSPASPLSNSGSYGSGSVYSCQSAL